MNSFVLKMNIERNIYEYSFFDLIFIYIIGGALGTFYETLFYIITEQAIRNYSGSALFFVNGTYGLGIVLLTMLLYRVKNWINIFLLGSLLTGVTEYFASFAIEKIFRIQMWNYSHLLTNINGRTTILFAFCWGLGGMVIVVFIIPKLLKYLHKIPKNMYEKGALILLGVIIFDICVSFLAMHRYAGRHFGVYYNDSISILLDKLFNDLYMNYRFPNLNFV